MNFGCNLKELRKLRKMSQEMLAEKVGVSRQSISKWENGEAYPEMNNILMLCKIFNCHINDLVHENFVDIDSLDEEIKMNVVKFKQEKQKRMKGLSKIVYVTARIMKILVTMGIMLSVITAIALPFLLKDISEDKVNILGNEYTYNVVDNKVNVYDKGTEVAKLDVESETSFSEYIKGKTTVQTIVIMEAVILSAVASFVLVYIVLMNVEKLFIQIHNGDTPFTLENVQYIKNISIFLIASTVVSYVVPIIIGYIAKIDFCVEFELEKLIYILIVFCLSYIFEYGYEIQKDSNGKMYGIEE